MLFRSNDCLPDSRTLSAGAHAHANWTLKTAGTYTVHFEVFGTPAGTSTVKTSGVVAFTVGELADAVGMEQSAVSHQLRMLRHLGLVHGERSGRSITYALYDHHVAQLLDEAVYHAEHLRLGAPDPAVPTS